MSHSQDLLTTQQFAKKAGVSTSTVSKWLRLEKIEGQKKGGKWIISISELSKVSAPPPSKTKPLPKDTATAATNTTGPKTGATSYSIEEFSNMTYLTEFGVTKWFKEGRLTAAADASGEPRVDASSLEHPAVQRLVR